MTTPEPRRCSTAAGVTAAIRAIQPVLAARPPLHLADLAALLGQIRGRRIRLIGTSLLPLPQPQMVTALWTQAPARDYLFHDDRMAGTHYHHDVVLHTLSHIFLDHAAPLRAGADAVLGTLFDVSGRAMLCPAGVLAVAEVSVEAEAATEADADMLAAWLAESTDLPGDGERRRLAMTQLRPGDPHRTRRLEGGRWLQMLTTTPEPGCVL
ncbi:hypothetical protein [Amycolatopsis tolypomycina]|uniref:hypothetical protein n=1 Tax=Amycolatopsis tolypomycina TaxID=208445 RepID=UPI0033A74E10